MSQTIKDTIAKGFESLVKEDSLYNHVDNCLYVKNSFGTFVKVPSELFATNNIILMFMICIAIWAYLNRLHVKMTTKQEYITKIVYGGFVVCSVGALFYPVRMKLVGLNVVMCMFLIYDIIRHDHKSGKDKW